MSLSSPYRETIRQAIYAITSQDPQDNFIILKKNKDLTEFKVEILWLKRKTEILEIKLNKKN